MHDESYLKCFRGADSKLLTSFLFSPRTHVCVNEDFSQCVSLCDELFARDDEGSLPQCGPRRPDFASLDSQCKHFFSLLISS